MARKIAFFPGAFDPIHLGHIRTARLLYEHVRAQGNDLLCYFLPVKFSRVGKKLLPLEDRLHMVALATQGLSYIALSDSDKHALGPRTNFERHQLLCSQGVVPDYWVYGSDAYNNEQLRGTGAIELVAAGAHLFFASRKDYPLSDSCFDIFDEPICIPHVEKHVSFLFEDGVHQGAHSFVIKMQLREGKISPDLPLPVLHRIQERKFYIS